MRASQLALFESVTRFSVWLLFFSLFSSASGIGAATALLFVAGTVVYWRDLRAMPRLPLFWPILALVAAWILSVAFAPGDGFSKPLGKLRYFFFYFLLVLHFARYPKLRVRLAKAAVPLAWLLGVVAALQFTGVFCPLFDFGFTPIAPAGLGAKTSGFFHARGLLYHHNPFAYTTLLAFYLLFGQALVAGTRDRRWYASGIAALLPSLAMSGSRGSWVALTVSLSVVGVVAARRHWKIFAGTFAALALVGLALSRILADRFASIQPSANGERLRLWEISWRLFLDAPVLGHGYHHGFELQRQRFMTEAEKANPHFPTDPHSLYFDLLATTGFVGTLAFVAFAAAALVSYARGLARKLEPEAQGALITGLGCWISFLVGTAFDSHFFHTQTLVATLFFLAYGQSVVFQTYATHENTRTSS